MTRGFQEVSEPIIKDIKTKLPYHASLKSAAYDFYSKQEVVIPSGKKHTFITDVKSYMLHDEYLAVVVRSSIGMKKNLRLTNQFGVIDSDYYNNSFNEGNIHIELHNFGEEDVVIEIGDRIAQGIFMKKLNADEGSYSKSKERIRSGGIGSSGV